MITQCATGLCCAYYQVTRARAAWLSGVAAQQAQVAATSAVTAAGAALYSAAAGPAAFTVPVGLPTTVIMAAADDSHSIVAFNPDDKKIKSTQVKPE